ncbi:MAG: patatin [Peptococcaceae bacterium]|nr:MAG: patatin [Peptococcaceae bacterium]
MASYRIMTFDGGGIRGALTANLLKRLNARFPELIEKTDLFAGTSTGSFIALGLASGLTPEDLVDLYSEEKGQFIFTPEHLNLLRPKYNNKHLRAVLYSVFSANLQLKDLKHNVLIPSFRVTGPGAEPWSPVFFNNFPGSATMNELVVDVALASSAAPTYFPSYRNFIDGGVVANNPSTAAVAIAVDKQAGRQNLNDIHLLSIGTGFNSYRITADTTEWGVLQWMLHPSPPSPLITVLTDGVVEADARFSSQLLAGRYFRLNPALPRPVPLDDYKQIPYLVNLAENFDLGPAIDWINDNWF